MVRKLQSKCPRHKRPIRQRVSLLKAMGLEDTEDLPHVPWEERVRIKAYSLWLERGCPIGSPEVDWYEAIRLIPDDRFTEEHFRMYMEWIDD